MVGGLRDTWNKTWLYFTEVEETRKITTGPLVNFEEEEKIEEIIIIKQDKKVNSLWRTLESSLHGYSVKNYFAIPELNIFSYD